MNDQNIVQENNQNIMPMDELKLKVPAGAILLIIAEVLTLINNFRVYGLTLIFSLLYSIPIFVVAIVFLVKKRGIAPLIATGVLLVCTVILYIILGSLFGAIINLLYWAPIVLLLLCDLIPIFRIKKKIFSIIFYVTFALLATIFLMFFFFPNIHVDFSVFLELGGLFWLGMFLINPYKKVSTTKNDMEHSAEVDLDEYSVSMSKHVCLLLFTCGIWMYIWIYKATKFTNLYAGEEERNPVSTLLLCMLVPFYSIYWTYKTASRIDAIAREQGVESNIKGRCLIFAILIGFVPPILMQGKINELAQKS